MPRFGWLGLIRSDEFQLGFERHIHKTFEFFFEIWVDY